LAAAFAVAPSLREILAQPVNPRSPTSLAMLPAALMTDAPAEITLYLRRLRDGDHAAAATMMPLVYDQLRAIAARVLRRFARAFLQQKLRRDDA
jgi:hypothetical protein